MSECINCLIIKTGLSFAMETVLFYYVYLSIIYDRTVSTAVGRIYRKHEHQSVKLVSRICYVQHICIAPGKYLSGDAHDNAARLPYLVLPLQKITLSAPSAKINVVFRLEHTEAALYSPYDAPVLFKLKYRKYSHKLLPYKTNFISIRVIYMEPVSERKELTLDEISYIAVFIIYIIFICPLKYSLFYKKLHIYLLSDDPVEPCNISQIRLCHPTGLSRGDARTLSAFI